MSEQGLTSKDLAELLECMNHYETDAEHYAKFHAQIIAHDVQQREELEQVKRDLDEAKCGEARCAQLEEALKYYADPNTYFGVGFFIDAPSGGFDEDFDEGHEDYDRPMPGKRARAALTHTERPQP